MHISIPDEVKSFISSYKYKIELHAHTYNCSGCSQISPKEIIHLAKERGLDAIAVTNHFFYDHGFYWEDEDPVNFWFKDYHKAKEEGERLGIKVYIGAEFRFLQNENDYLVYGVDEAFMRKMVNRSDLDIESFHKEFHNDNILIIQAHPFRNDLFAVNPEFVDGYEIMNMHPWQRSCSALAAVFAKQNKIPIVTIGTDLHQSEHTGISSLRTKILPENDAELINLLRSGDYIFDIGGYPMLPFDIF